MKKIIFTIGLLLHVVGGAFAQWQPAGDKIKTEWAGQVGPQNALPEYPRPIMERPDWQNLNGLWEYSILPAGLAEPDSFAGEILVPFAVESSLSGVQKSVGETNELWYRRSFTVPAGWRSRRVLLHFGAVDWKADVFVNDIKVGTHTGGYTPFYFDVTPFLLPSARQKLTVRVWDGTDAGYQPRGKQVSRPEGIWYTPVTGIWQTVWLEPVNEKYITSLGAVPDVDRNRISVNVRTQHTQPSDVVEVKIFDQGQLIAAAKAAATCQALELSIPEAKLWSPATPFLYDMVVSLHSNGRVTDHVKSYCAMRKVSAKRDEHGIVRLQLNNRNCFQYGPLDQGWWPDGLYTAPTDAALAYDIQKTKDFGFNMIRKHVKVEPARWYTHCDRLGILVWQDMPSGDRSPQWQNHRYFNGGELQRSAESEANYRKEWQEIMDYLRSYPSIVTWVPFNEAWGQFKTAEIAEWTKGYDPSRLVNPASGGNFYPAGDIMDLHNYPAPDMYLFDAARVNVLGEYGGIGMPVPDHLWQPERNWGYVQFQTAKAVTDEYIKYADQLKPLIQRGFSAAVYTQTTDVEGEVNGLLTYDRKMVKVEENRLKAKNQEVISSLK
jgi:beta-galactosidase/beta-glucuronidase